MDLRKIAIAILMAAPALCAGEEPAAQSQEAAAAAQAGDGLGRRGSSHLRALDRAFLEAGQRIVAGGQGKPYGARGSLSFAKGTGGDFVMSKPEEPGAGAPKGGSAGMDRALGELKAEAAPLPSAGAGSGKDASGMGARSAADKPAAAPAQPPSQQETAAPEAGDDPGPAPSQARPESKGDPGAISAKAADAGARQMIADAREGVGKSGAARSVEVRRDPAPVRRQAGRHSRSHAASPAPSRKAAAAAQRGLRDENGAVSSVHNGLEDVTASDLQRSGAFSAPVQAQKSPWEDEVRRISGYSPDRPPLPGSGSAPSVAELDSEFGNSPAPATKRPVARRDYSAARRMTVYSRQEAAAQRQAPSKAEADEARMLKAVPEAGRARIPDAVGLARD